MKQNLNRSAANANSKGRNTPLKLEQLEARLLMAFDALDSQVDQLTTVVLNSNSNPTLPLSSAVSSDQTLASLLISRPDGQLIAPNSRVDQTTRSIQLRAVGLNSEGLELSTAPRVNWIVSSSSRKARASIQTTAGVTTISFSQFADYQITLRSGNSSTRFNVRAVAPATFISLFNAKNTRLAENALVTISASKQVFNVVGFSSAKTTTTLLQASEWSVVSSPEGSSPRFQTQGNQTTVEFDRVGLYTLQVTNGSLTRSVRVQVNGTLSSLSVDPSENSIATGDSLQLNAVGLDQFQQRLASQPKFSWAATGGQISATGLYQAGATAGSFRVTVRSGSLSASVSISLTASDNNDSQTTGGFSIVGINDTGLRGLIKTYYADSSISRTEMIGMLRSVANDNIVTATELADLRYIVSSDSPYNLPAHVRGLTRNLVHENSANLRFRNQNAGNLVAGSSGTLLNQLVDKWFLGADLPSLTSSSIAYRTAVGSLFNGTPGFSDAQQGMLGDCYFLTSLVSIGQLNPTAIQNMFTDNGDGTFTVRFFAGSLGFFWQGSLISAGFISGSGVADYVTVNRNLPTLSKGGLAYSGYGRSVLSASTPLWLALAEKAYAQWNETGRSGRNGTNSYSGIEGGWMSNVNAQVLGTNSTYYAVNSESKQAMISALSGNRAVTIGTNPNASTGGLVGSHAYVVSGYNATNDTFSLYNPWGTKHPTPLTWAQLQNQTSAYVVADPSGALSVGGSVLQSTGLTVSAPLPEVTLESDRQGSNQRLDSLPGQFAVEETSPLLSAGSMRVVSVAKDHQSQSTFSNAEVCRQSSIDSCLDESAATLEQLLNCLADIS